MDPRDLLPQEVWELVFDKVEEAQDWLNLYRSSSSFQEVVGDKRTTALFPQVFPHVMEYMGSDLGDILGIRLVCKKWKVAVEQMLENSDSVYERTELERAYALQNITIISSFLEQFGTASGNPFVGRFASFTFNYNRNSEVIEEYSVLVARVLDKFGAQLKTLHVEFFETRFDNYATRVRSCIQLTPNLDALSVTLYSLQGQNLRPGGEQIPNIESAPLPLLNLKSISLTGFGERGSLLNLHNAVLRMSCKQNSLKSVRTSPGFPSALLSYPTMEGADVYLDALEDCSNLASTSWPLSKLTVGHSLDVNIGSLFECVEHFKMTLTSLHCQRSLFDDPSFNLKLDLPHLTQLTIKEHPSMSLDFLTNLASLEVLSISNTRLIPNEVEEETWLQRFIECVQAEVGRRGLWEALPKLKKIWLVGPLRLRRNFEVQQVLHVSSRDRVEFQRKANQRWQ